MIERIEKPDPYNDEFTIVQWRATTLTQWGTPIFNDYDTEEEAKAMIERQVRLERVEQKEAAE